MEKMRVLFSEDAISRRVWDLTTDISAHYRTRGIGSIEIVQLLEGASFFSADLARELYKANVEKLAIGIQSMKVRSYNGTQSSGDVQVVLDVQKSLQGKDVLVVEDIVDTGLTLERTLSMLRGHQPASLRVCTLLDKKERRKVDVPIDHTGFVIPDLFVVCYGMDCEGKYRALPFIGVLEK